MNLEVSLLNIDKVEPNPWNPNVQNEQQFKAEIESITNNGFLAPILVRAFDDHYQIIDGEHRFGIRVHQLPMSWHRSHLHQKETCCISRGMC